MSRTVIARLASAPRSSRWIALLFGFVTLAALMLAACSSVGDDKHEDKREDATNASTQIFRQADATFGAIHCSGGAHAHAHDNAAGSTGSPSAPVSLPYYWDRELPRQSGTATFRIRFPHEAGGREGLGFYLARAANSFEMRLNGKLLATAGDLCAPALYGGQRPLHVPVPQAMLQPDNELLVTISARADARGGLSAIEFGPDSVTRAHYDRALWFRVIGPLVIAAVSLVLAGISLMIWWRQRDPLFGLYALAEIAWAISLAEFFLTDAPLPRGLWQVIILSGRAVFMLATAKFAFIVIDVRARWPGWLVNGYLWLKLPLILLMASVLSMPYLKLADWAVNVVMACCVGGALVWSAWRRPNRERIVLAGALGLATALTLADFIRITMIGDFYWETALTKYVSLLFSLAMAWLLVERFTGTSRMLADLNRDLDRKVAQKEDELRQLYARSREIEREQAAMKERGRIMRDMHDGLGSTLVGALSLVRSGQSSSPVMQKHLQQALDALKLSVDAMQDTGGDLAAVLGTLRYRLRERLEAAGMTVDWQVDRLPELKGLTPQIVRELQYLLLEAFSNAMQYAPGGVIRVIARSLTDDADDAEAIVIEIRDSGPGFDTTAASQGHGLANMHSRAASIGGELQIESSPHGTAVRLLLRPDRWTDTAMPRPETDPA
ncbi:ATP-binding protein [Cupriavidus metallidurans]|uniref:sensor histidine kinase n=1 Tax=Cupriavidus TaxID=106589 RepID=UPI00257B9869|nr:MULTISPECIES: ATP-binding protein [unclassified Cupriavidus]